MQEVDEAQDFVSVSEEISVLAPSLNNFACSLLDDGEASVLLADLASEMCSWLTTAGVSVWLAQGDRMDANVVTGDGEAIKALARVEQAGQQGPCIDAYHGGEPVLIVDLVDEAARWPELVEVAGGVGIAAVAAVPLSVDGVSLGAMGLYHHSPHRWSTTEIRHASVMARLATGYLANKARTASLGQTAEHLKQALESRVVIEQAKGVLAGADRISVDEAFRSLQRYARRHNESLRVVASAVVHDGLRPHSVER